MKTSLSLLFATLLFVTSSCKEAAKYPVVTELGELTLSGKIISMPNPATTEPPLPGLVLGLETTDGDYVLSVDSNWIWEESFVFDEVEYAAESTVSITGQAVHVKFDRSVEYFEIEIEFIESSPARSISQEN